MVSRPFKCFQYIFAVYLKLFSIIFYTLNSFLVVVLKREIATRQDRLWRETEVLRQATTVRLELQTVQSVHRFQLNEIKEINRLPSEPLPDEEALKQSQSCENFIMQIL